MGVKQLGCDVDCVPPFRARVKRSGSVFVHVLYAFMAWTGTALPLSFSIK